MPRGRGHSRLLLRGVHCPHVREDRAAAGGQEEEEEDFVVGEPLQRPPPGWDDLVGGGAQGRWAWGKESKSPLERGENKHAPCKTLCRFSALLFLGLALSGAQSLVLVLWFVLRGNEG